LALAAALRLLLALALSRPSKPLLSSTMPGDTLDCVGDGGDEEAAAVAADPDGRWSPIWNMDEMRRARTESS